MLHFPSLHFKFIAEKISMTVIVVIGSWARERHLAKHGCSVILLCARLRNGIDLRICGSDEIWREDFVQLWQASSRIIAVEPLHIAVDGQDFRELMELLKGFIPISVVRFDPQEGLTVTFAQELENALRGSQARAPT